MLDWVRILLRIAISIKRLRKEAQALTSPPVQSFKLIRIVWILGPKIWHTIWNLYCMNYFYFKWKCVLYPLFQGVVSNYFRSLSRNTLFEVKRSKSLLHTGSSNSTSVGVKRNHRTGKTVLMKEFFRFERTCSIAWN